MVVPQPFREIKPVTCSYTNCSNLFILFYIFVIYFQEDKSVSGANPASNSQGLLMI